MVDIHARGIAVGPRFQAGHLVERPDGARIAAMSGAIAVNLLALLLLLIPMSIPPPLAEPDTPRETMELLPPEPVVVEVTAPLPPARPEVQPPEVIEKRIVPQLADDPAPVVVDSGEPAEPVAITEPADTIAIEPATKPAVAAVRLEYASAPPPVYPRDAARRRLEGTVMLQVLVGADGRPLEVLVHASSGHRSLDEAARRHVLKRWTFRPAMRDGRAVQAIGLVPVAFDLR